MSIACHAYRVPVVGLLMLLTGTAFAAIGDTPYVSFERTARAAAVVAAGAAAPIVVDAQDYPGVLRAAADLQADIERVTSVRPLLKTDGLPDSTGTVVIAGTLGHSALIDDLVKRGKLRVKEIEGRWESFLIEVVDRPSPGIERALVIAGSDKRGTIYGLYDVSEQIGVSPWYWWADVPVAQHDATLRARRRRVSQGEPEGEVPRHLHQRRGARARRLGEREKFGGFNHEFYAHVFELILRLRGNYLWPAMWGKAFNEDDPLNRNARRRVRHRHGHLAPRADDARARRMASATATRPVELREERGEAARRSGATASSAWRDYEKIVTVGMRGDGDEPMSRATANIALLERIVADQRKIIAEVTGKEPSADAAALGALQGSAGLLRQRHARAGRRDAALVRRQLGQHPAAADARRSASAPAAPASTTTSTTSAARATTSGSTPIPLPKVWEQMNLAWQYGADRIWIVNVGDLKPMEFPIEFFLTTPGIRRSGPTRI